MGLKAGLRGAPAPAPLWAPQPHASLAALLRLKGGGGGVATATERGGGGVATATERGFDGPRHASSTTIWREKTPD